MADMILVIAELEDGKAKKITHELLTAAQEVAEEMEYEVAVAALGDGLEADDLAQELGGRGAEVLFLLEDELLAEYSVEPHAAALQQLIESEEPALVLFGMTPTGRDLAPRVAAKLALGLATDVTAITVEDDELLFTRPIYSGQITATVKIKSTPALVTVRANSWAAAEADDDKEAEIEEFELDDLPEPRSEVLSRSEKGGERPALTEADRIVSGGRGFQGAENFGLLEELADELNAAVGTTRAVVDAGWRPYEEQVGQTGKTVSPQLYVALGISGALQHLTGMRTSKVIVAVNKDKEAPIFRLADYGIVGDLFEVAPAMLDAIRELE
jgi:electron transfer flavoprotein alpha subunit